MVEITTGGLTNQSQALVSIIECNDNNSTSPFSEVWLKIDPPDTGTEVFIYECFDNQTSNLLTQDNTSITWTTTAPSDQVKEWLFVQGATNINGAVYAYKSGNTTMVGNATFAGDVTISKNQGQLTLYGGDSSQFYSKIYCGSNGYLTLDATQGTRSILLNTSSSIQFSHNGTERMRIHDSGGVVIGNGIVATDPDTLGGNSGAGDLHVQSEIRTGNGGYDYPAYSTYHDLNTGMYFPAADSIGFATGGANRLTISSTTATFAGNMAVNGGVTSVSSYYYEAVFGGTTTGSSTFYVEVDMDTEAIGQIIHIEAIANHWNSDATNYTVIKKEGWMWSYSTTTSFAWHQIGSDRGGTSVGTMTISLPSNNRIRVTKDAGLNGWGMEWFIRIRTSCPLTKV